MTEQEIRAGLSDLHTLALTAWAEARGDNREGGSSLEERVAVLCVIRNRVQRSGGALTYKAVCLAPRQFSCWNAGKDANHMALLALAERVLGGDAADSLYTETLWLAHGVRDGVILDRTLSATHYYAPLAMVPQGRVPSWAMNKPFVEIGRQRFLAAV